MIKPSEAFSFDNAFFWEEGKWLLRLTITKEQNSVFEITDENKMFSIFTRRLLDWSFGYRKNKRSFSFKVANDF